MNCWNIINEFSDKLNMHEFSDKLKMHTDVCYDFRRTSLRS